MRHKLALFATIAVASLLNSWHGTAVKEGQQIDVAAMADGRIVEEGD